MSECKEGLSALMDGQTSDFETRRLLQQVAGDDELGQTWRRYQVVRSVLQGEALGHARDDLSARIAASIDVEPAHHEKVSSHDGQSFSGIWRSVASMAVAASVTAVIILGANNFGSDSSTPALSAPSTAYVPPPTPISNDLVRAQFGDITRVTQSSSQQSDVIRLSQGLKSYIDQHQQLSKVGQPQWETAWIPDGYHAVRHDMLPHGELMVYSNGEGTISVTVEPRRYQRSSEGVVQSDGLVAVGRRQGDNFVTVVGDIPLMIADRIATNVTQIR
ncbi:Sigma factor RpoE negative regulatory protein RseA [Marinobacterium lacunae]|uniref:Sigma factor RpoE negative regulatory protein RseA n=1 Tax=Marinobacterium lacunae TaxID=1232683 RepID=A0A081G474_9GAMM|nr:MucB/RseB C-terminal domain-containing protein [Marinobacterium lacunae]KEA65579.1 Sigma factor RpoE negative regulatory protein RseA [Marinobacterium lacunae]MBR9884069.1 hypothetical protein [Oceanospirillales bacterium]